MYLDSDKFLVGAQGGWSHKAHYGDNNWSSDKFWVASPGGASQVASFCLFGNNAMPCEVAIQKSRSNTVGSMSALQVGDPLGALQFNGSPDNSMRQAATFACYVDSSGTINNSSLPTNLRFYTNNNGAVIPTEKLRITSAGRVGIGTNEPNSLVNVYSGRTSPDTSTVYPFTSAQSGTYTYTPYLHELTIHNDIRGTEGSFAGIFFRAGSDSDGSKIGAARISAVETGNYRADLVFGTRDTSFAERLRIQYDGRVLIGHSLSLIHI